jgi:hypothetical protein
LALAAAKSAAFEDSLRASSQWQATVALGKRLLAALHAHDADAAGAQGSGGGADWSAESSASEEVLEVWRRLQAEPEHGSAAMEEA